jgi:Zn-finger nucleic acid-binding protein
MVAFELDGVEIDRCVACHGTWLDNGEVQLIARQAGVAPGGLTQALVESEGVRGARRRCPRCLRRLDVIQLGVIEPDVVRRGGIRPAPPSPLEIDRCPGGCGVWFDDGEMQQFIARFDEGEQGAVARFFADWFGTKDSPQASERG